MYYTETQMLGAKKYVRTQKKVGSTGMHFWLQHTSLPILTATKLYDASVLKCHLVESAFYTF